MLKVVWECVQKVMLMLIDNADTKVSIPKLVCTLEIIEEISIQVQASVHRKCTNFRGHNIL